MAENEFKLPDVGEGLTEAEIVTWMVKVGDTIKINDIICEIETAKSLVELPSPYAGTVTRLMATEGETVAVGSPIIAVSSDGTGRPAAPTGAADKPGEHAPSTLEAEATVGTTPSEQSVEPGMVGSPAPKADGATPTLVGYGPKAAETKRRPRKGSSSDAAPAASAPAASTSAASAPAPLRPSAPEIAPTELASESGPGAASGMAAKVLAKPPVRKLARDLGVDLDSVTPTGPGGTITRADVEGFTAPEPAGVETAPEPAYAAAVDTSGARETRIPIKGVRKLTAQAMVGSAFTAPHVTEWMTLDVTKTMRLVNKLRKDRAFADLRVTPLLLVARAVCLAVRRTPEVNAVWDEAAQEIVHKHYVNLGIAAATPRGLVVPNIKDADSLSAVELARAIGELTKTARSGRTSPAEMAGGTFTITNVGMFGVDGGTPILNPGETGILCMGAIRKTPWVVGNKIKPRWTMTLALSFDHRIVDGEQGSRFLSDVAKIISDPTHALLV